MNPDLSKLLEQWPFEPGKLTCRFITGPEGEPHVQIRIELGILQLHADGRPDGQRPHGFPSLLDYFEHLLDGPDDSPHHPLDGGPDAGPDLEPASDDPAGEPASEKHSLDPQTPGDDPTDRASQKRHLSPEDCRLLREEAELFYRRYIALLALEDYDRVVRDTTRNLRVLDLCQEYAQREDDRTILEDLRPYIVMTRTRAVASAALKDGEAKAAMLALDEGLEALRRIYSDSGRPQAFEKSTEVQSLRTMREGLAPKLPVSQKAELRSRLSRAIQEENYELAAILRDELKQLPD